jgi:hypothetical protein
MNGRDQRRKWRRQRQERREDLESLGRTPSRVEYIYRVEPEIVWPLWVWDVRIKDLDSKWLGYVWLAEKVLVSILAGLDRDEGGKPKVDRFEARPCHRCGILRLGQLAESRRKLDESAVDGRDLPCSPECVLREQQRKGKA